MDFTPKLIYFKAIFASFSFVLAKWETCVSRVDVSVDIPVDDIYLFLNRDTTNTQGRT